jgi:hypothetical protein
MQINRSSKKDSLIKEIKTCAERLPQERELERGKERSWRVLRTGPFVDIIVTSPASYGRSVSEISLCRAQAGESLSSVAVSKFLEDPEPVGRISEHSVFNGELADLSVQQLSLVANSVRRVDQELRHSLAA